MLKFYKSINSKLETLKNFEHDCWIELSNPKSDEIHKVSEITNIDIETLNYLLDEEEQSRVEVGDDYILVIVDIPLNESSSNSSYYTTVPLGIIITKTNIITISTVQTDIINGFINGNIKNFNTYEKDDFLLKILLINAKYYLSYLKQISKRTNQLEREVHKSLKNKELLQILELEKSLIYFSTSLKSNEVVLKKIANSSHIKKYIKDMDLLEDVLIENKQAVEMAGIYGDILSRVMDAFSAIIDNNQNSVMQFLTTITFVLSIPTIISGLFGMNVSGIPFEHNKEGFFLVVIITVIISLITSLIMYLKKLF
ncbi:magnesium transporter CorA family protein [Paeniclostridium sp. NSJ-45]|uniref:Magnesium transporter CorA family protein n=1 Tax=Paeniclostridium hominis TaxID=2764329 RepID=A0ABR7K717_9FIRM|nr:magnesium transporter CorA family protein [Paeniclostridium hominis]MBC6004899.1 magnesium transporter CorA family protein [Paeniclostridium hominis]